MATQQKNMGKISVKRSKILIIGVALSNTISLIMIVYNVYIIINLDTWNSLLGNIINIYFVIPLAVLISSILIGQIITSFYLFKFFKGKLINLIANITLSFILCFFGILYAAFNETLAEYLLLGWLLSIILKIIGFNKQSKIYKKSVYVENNLVENIYAKHSDKKKKYIKICIISFACILTFGGVTRMIWQQVRPLHPPTTLNDIAWDVDRRHGFTVHILENGEYVPYLVLTNNYNGDGNVLLLRKHLLDEMMVFNYLQNEVPEGLTSGVNFRPSYYRTSKIDNFLNGEFLERLSAIEDIIVNSEIVVTHIDSIGRAGTLSQIIERKVFLLSRMEVTGMVSNISLAEGRHLSYFRVTGQIFGNRSQEAQNLRIATTADGEPHNWWLRTSVNAHVITVGVIDFRGGGGHSCKKSDNSS